MTLIVVFVIVIVVIVAGVVGVGADVIVDIARAKTLAKDLKLQIINAAFSNIFRQGKSRRQR